VFGKVQLDSLHRRFLGLILAHTDTAVSTPLFTFDRNTHATFTGKGNGREVSRQRALHSLANHNTPAPTNQSIACF